jgi:DnaD/phage-associated family protein
MAQLLQIGIFTSADDQGRMKANPAYLRSVVFPYGEMSLKDIAEWLDLIEANGTIRRYEADGKDYLQLLNWWEYQSLSFAMPSDCPAPDGWKDRIRYNRKKSAILTYNWITSTGATMPDTCDASGEPLPDQPKRSRQPEPPPEPPQDVLLDQPPHVPHGNPHGNPHGVLKEKEKEKEKEDNYMGDLGAQAVNGSRRLDRRTDTEFGELCKQYEQEFGVLSPTIADSLSDLLNEYKSSRMILDAFTESVKANKRTLRYVEGVLRNWRAEGKQGKTAKQPAKAKALPVIAGRLVDNPFSL